MGGDFEKAIGTIASAISFAISFTIFFCVDGETEVTVLGKEHIYKKPVSEVKKGELVLTYKGKNLVYSEVKENKKLESEREFFTIKVKDKDENIKTISVTDNHSLIIFNKESNEPEFKYASQLQVGDLTRTTGGISEVVEINKELKKNCYQIVVEQGTFLANDILIGAFYIKENESQKQLKGILDTAKIPISQVN